MVKIFLSVRNRLGITKKCIQALQKHSELPHQIYVYDNLTDYRVDEHFSYFSDLYQKGIVQQVTFNTNASTFNAFSKAVACNQFGHNHLQDPNKDKYTYLLFLDNDIIVAPGWDTVLRKVWIHVIKSKMKNIHVITQLPGGIMRARQDLKIEGFDTKLGKLGGSGFWSIRPTFFDTVGFLNIPTLVGANKKHDQNYWRKLDVLNNGKEYILGIQKLLAQHCGSQVGSICNRLTKNKDADIRFVESDQKIEAMEFDDFYKWISEIPILRKW